MIIRGFDLGTAFAILPSRFLSNLGIWKLFSIVNASIPLLIGKPDPKRFGFVINFEDETVFITSTFEVFALETTIKGHLALPLREEECLDDVVFMMSECDSEEKEKKIRKFTKF